MAVPSSCLSIPASLEMPSGNDSFLPALALGEEGEK